MDFSFSHFPFDLVLFGLIAAFLALRLRSILGTRVGVEPAPPPGAAPRPGPV
ncbi:Tim44 domain-containing protein, partial [Nguyenibacter vanlangensis]|nr:Tim44 domain-containing protein [Nguyenibacter vanlangensis]